MGICIDFGLVFKSFIQLFRQPLLNQSDRWRTVALMDKVSVNLLKLLQLWIGHWSIHYLKGQHNPSSKKLWYAPTDLSEMHVFLAAPRFSSCCNRCREGNEPWEQALLDWRKVSDSQADLLVTESLNTPSLALHSVFGSAAVAHHS